MKRRLREIGIGGCWDKELEGGEKEKVRGREGGR